MPQYPLLAAILIMASALLLLDAATRYMPWPEIARRWHEWRKWNKIEAVWHDAHADNEWLDSAIEKVGQLQRCATCGQGGICLYNTKDLKCAYDVAKFHLAHMRQPSAFDTRSFWGHLRDINVIFEAFINTQRAYANITLARDIIAKTEAKARGDSNDILR